MTQNLQIADQADQQAESAEAAEHVQDARSLIDHLNSVLSVEEDGAASADAQPASVPTFPEAPSFARAIMRQSDQIQYLVEQVSRLDGDTEVTRLRDVVVDLCAALTEVILRMKQDSSQAAGKIGVLVEAITIIGGVADSIDDSRNITSLLSAAKAAADRLVSLEGISNEARAAILALEEIQSRSQNKIRDLSAGLIKLNEGVESGSAEIAGLQQRIESTDHALAQGLTSLGDEIAANRQDAAGLQHRIESTDHALAQGLTLLGDEIAASRQDAAGLQQRIESSDRALAQGLASLGDEIATDRTGIAGLQQRIESTDHAFAQGLTSLGDEIAASRQDAAGLQQRIESSDRALAQGLASLGDEIATDRTGIAGLQQRIESTDHALAQGLTSLGDEIAASRQDAAGLQQRLESADRVLAQGLAKLDDNVGEGRKEIDGLRQRIGSFDQVLGQGLVTLNERTTTLRDDLGRVIARIASVEDSNAMYGVFKDKIESLNGRLAELERNSGAEIKSWRLHESERNAALITKLEILEQKNHSVTQSAEQVAVRLNAAEQTIATVVQRQKALSSVHDRVVRLLLANPDLQS